MKTRLVYGKEIVLSFIIALTAGFIPVMAQPGPIQLDGRRIDGTWNLRFQWRHCESGDPQLQPTPAMISFAAGGVVTEVDSVLWCDIGHCTSLGVWKHVAGRRYLATYKRTRLDSTTGNPTGYVIASASILHSPDDTLSTTDTVNFFALDGTLEATRCRTSTGTRFTGEN